MLILILVCVSTTVSTYYVGALVNQETLNDVMTDTKFLFDPKQDRISNHANRLLVYQYTFYTANTISQLNFTLLPPKDFHLSKDLRISTRASISACARNHTSTATSDEEISNLQQLYGRETVLGINFKFVNYTKHSINRNTVGFARKADEFVKQKVTKMFARFPLRSFLLEVSDFRDPCRMKIERLGNFLTLFFVSGEVYLLVTV